MKEIAQDILVLAGQGDRKAFESIYRHASGFVYTVALRVTNSRHDAEEVTQDVFLKVYHNLKHFQFRSSFTTWLYRITMNTALNFYKRASRHMKGREDFESVARTHPSDTDSVQEAVRGEERQESKVRVEHLLETLSSEQRICIVLREIEGLSYQEISQALKININTVRTRLKRAREALLLSARGGRV